MIYAQKHGLNNQNRVDNESRLFSFAVYFIDIKLRGGETGARLFLKSLIFSLYCAWISVHGVLLVRAQVKGVVVFKHKLCTRPTIRMTEIRAKELYKAH